MNLPSRSGEGQLAGVALTFRAVLRGTSGSPKDRLEYWVMPSPDSQAHQKKQSKMDCFLKYIGIYKNFQSEKCITVGVSQVFNMFHASKMMSSFTG